MIKQQRRANLHPLSSKAKRQERNEAVTIRHGPRNCFDKEHHFAPIDCNLRVMNRRDL